MRPYFRLYFLLLFCFPAILHASPASRGSRQIQSFDSDWRFLQSDTPNAESPTFDDSAWKPVTLPHDWSIAGPVEENAPSRAAGGFFPTGIGWYRHTLTLAKLDPAKRTFIAFDGIMANSDVYCNGELLGHRPYGYVSFNYDLTPHLHAGNNIIAVRVDNSQQPASRWYPGAGINRHVRLITTNAIHVAPWGTFITTPDIHNSDATVNVRSTVLNDSAAAAVVTLAITIDAPGNIHVISSPGHIAKVIAAHSTADLEESLRVDNPDLWDLAHGSLYTAQVTVLRNGKPIDNEDVAFGIREFYFDPNQGFFLNGVHHKIYGVALHADAGALGTAVPLAAWARRLTALRALGVNAIRTAHNPPAPEFLDLADRMGFLVMDEIFDCWTVAKNPYDYHLYFKEWSLHDTADTVRRDRNHPSIILWSAGNEIHDTPKPDIAIPILKSLVGTFHANDPTRPVTQALFRPNVAHDYDNGLADLLDVIGQNYREQEILKAHADKPTRKIIGTENTHDRNQWVAMRDHPEYSGQFLWSGIDYLGEAGHWPSIGAGSGLLLTTSLPRARAYERQSWWADATTQPMVRIARRVQAARRPIDPGYPSPTSNNQAATTAPNAPLDPTMRFGQSLLLDWSPKDQSPHAESIEIYTNAEEVELFLNNKSLGTQKLHADASPITFQVPFEPGTLKAIARTNNKIVAQDSLRTAGKPARIQLSHDDLPELSNPVGSSNGNGTPLGYFLTPDWNDVAYVLATLVDANGTVIPDSETRIHFFTSGPGKIIAVDNGNLLDHDPFQATDRKLYEGHALAILRATAPTGAITLTATTEGLPPATLTLHAAPPKNDFVNRSF
ncbi:MAG TPA: glycoside hydrolase family 2 TIM barrel-domain containing protein [Edaphobacter sp.]|nr:glycoside hydrolase family 2 TIM barrel-domain containing protein [Edaphobacter sp.]